MATTSPEDVAGPSATCGAGFDSTLPVSIRGASVARNTGGGTLARRWRWRHARAACWALLQTHVGEGVRVAIVDVGNGDDLPLARFVRRAGSVDLIDLDARALKRARRRCAVARTPVRRVVEDVSSGAADLIVRRALGEGANRVRPLATPVGRGSYDVVIADLFATHLLYPALADSGLAAARIDATLLTEGQRLTEAVTARLHAAAPEGAVIHLRDLLGWWHGHDQPLALDAALVLVEADPATMLTLAAGANAPSGCDPRAASRALGAEVIDTRFWRWPFAPGTEYLVCASVARTRRVTLNDAGSTR